LVAVVEKTSHDGSVGIDGEAVMEPRLLPGLVAGGLQRPRIGKWVFPPGARCRRRRITIRVVSVIHGTAFRNCLTHCPLGGKKLI